MKRLDEALKRAEKDAAIGWYELLPADYELVMTALRLYRAEALAWRAWYDGCVPDDDNTIWAGGDEWANAFAARAATEAFERGA